MPTSASEAVTGQPIKTASEFFDGAKFTAKVDKGYSSSSKNFKATPAALSREPGAFRESLLGQDSHAVPYKEIAAMGENGHLDESAVIDYPPQGDGVSRARLRVPTEYAEKRDPTNSKQGYFELVRDPDGTINHAAFKADPEFFAEHAVADPPAAPAPRDVYSVDDVPDAYRSTGDEPLYRGDRTPPDVLKARGGLTREATPQFTPQRLSLEDHVNPSGTLNAPDQWVSTTSNPEAAFHPMYSGYNGFVYEFQKPGGVDVNALFGQPQHGIEREFTFNNVEWSSIKGWRPIEEGPNYTRVLGDFVENPDYKGP